MPTPNTRNPFLRSTTTTTKPSSLSPISPISPISPTTTTKPPLHLHLHTTPTPSPTNPRQPKPKPILCNLAGHPLPPRLGTHPSITLRRSPSTGFAALVTTPLAVKTAYLRWRIQQWHRQRAAHARRGDAAVYGERLARNIREDEDALAEAVEAVGRGDEVVVVREAWREVLGREGRERRGGKVGTGKEALEAQAGYLGACVEGYLQRLAETEDGRMRVVFSDLAEQDRRGREEVLRRTEGGEGEKAEDVVVEKARAERAGVKEDRMRTLRPRKGGRVVKKVEKKRVARRVRRPAQTVRSKGKLASIAE